MIGQDSCDGIGRAREQKVLGGRGDTPPPDTIEWGRRVPDHAAIGSFVAARWWARAVHAGVPRVRSGRSRRTTIGHRDREPGAGLAWTPPPPPEGSATDPVRSDRDPVGLPEATQSHRADGATMPGFTFPVVTGGRPPPGSLPVRSIVDDWWSDK